MPTPDDGGPGGPAALPNGALFILLAALEAAASSGGKVVAIAVSVGRARVGSSFLISGIGSSGARPGFF
jgi:hypothetical protein